MNHEMLIEKLKIVTESQLSAEERAARYEELMQGEEKTTTWDWGWSEKAQRPYVQKDTRVARNQNKGEKYWCWNTGCHVIFKRNCHFIEIAILKFYLIYNNTKLTVKFNLQGSRAAIRNLNSKINKLDHDSLKQTRNYLQPGTE